MVEMKRMGLAVVDHHPVVNEADRSKLYTPMFMNQETPLGLANQVQFDIRLYFFRRGMENMEKMRKTDFRVHTDPKTLHKYVMKTTDELTKKHRENDKENFSGVMPESPGIYIRRMKKKFKINIQIYMFSINQFFLTYS